MKVQVLSRHDLAAGLALAGLSVTRSDPTGAPAAVARLTEDPDTGIVLIDEGLYRALPADLVARLDREAVPILAPIPEPRWDETSQAEAFVMDILRRAIGYRVRPR